MISICQVRAVRSNTADQATWKFNLVDAEKRVHLKLMVEKLSWPEWWVDEIAGSHSLIIAQNISNGLFGNVPWWMDGIVAMAAFWLSSESDNNENTNKIRGIILNYKDANMFFPFDLQFCHSNSTMAWESIIFCGILTVQTKVVRSNCVIASCLCFDCCLIFAIRVNVNIEEH